jgi:hypothetical protein
LKIRKASVYKDLAGIKKNRLTLMGWPVLSGGKAEFKFAGSKEAAADIPEYRTSNAAIPVEPRFKNLSFIVYNHTL